MNTNNLISVAIDAMGGDFGCEPIIAGVLQALDEREFIAVLVGDENEIKPRIPQKYLKFIKFIHASEVFTMEELATDVLKRKDTSIYKAIDLVKNGECDAVVSAGHSGATMSLATLRVGRLKGVSRPPIATFMPTSAGKYALLLDVGANVDCKPEHLFEFALMGEAYAEEIMGLQSPKIGLLSNGEEDCKGNEVTKETFSMLKNNPNFKGNIEGSGIFDGSFDVIVCDGFVGNVVLKSPISILGALLMKKSLKSVKKSTNYEEYGGAPLLGIKSCVIISHGKSSPKAVKNAIFQALKFSNSKINQIIESKIEKSKVKG